MAESSFARQLKKGVMDMIVLQLVGEKDTYGYELIQELGRRGEDFFTLKEGTLYPVLYRLEDNGLIEAFWKHEEGRSVPKKYYRITENGREKLREYIGVWKAFENCVDSLCGEGEP